MKRVPFGWRGQKINYRVACRVVENCYKQIMKERYGNRLNWVKLMDCGDVKKRKLYVVIAGNFLSMLAKYFDNVVFESEELLKEIVLDVVKEAVQWYKDYFVFTHLGNVKVFEVFDKKVLKEFGTVGRYIEIKKKKFLKKSDAGVDIAVDGIELQKIGNLYTF